MPNEHARVIVALDVPGVIEAIDLVDRIGDRCDFYKIGSELFTAAGPGVVARVRERGHDVFLDLKLHDIPNTVERAARSAAALGVALLTVHASGGDAMLRAAVAGAGEHCGILGVTVLTSLDARALGSAWGREVASVESEVLRLAGLVHRAAAHGVVCSAWEASAVLERYGPDLHVLVPGIRLEGGSTHDQARVATPGDAVRAGARYLVLGRAVTRAADPREALERIAEAIA